SYDYTSTKSYVFYFIFFSIFSISVLSKKIDFYSLYLFMSYILFVVQPILMYNVFTRDYDIGLLLGISYAILPNFIANLLILTSTKNSLTKIISCITISISSFFFITKGNRGVILCILAFFILKFLFKNKYSNGLRLALSGLFTFLFLAILSNLSIVFKFIKSSLSYFHIEIYAIDKTLNLIIENQNLDSGRTFLFEKLFNDIHDIKDIALGKGIGYFEEINGVYTHNLFAQYFIEGGLMYLVLPISVFFILVFKLFNGKKSKENVTVEYCFFLVSIFIPLMLSNVYWVSPLYWLASYYILLSASKKRITIEF
ncbi:hypothetical protein, partial [Enterococcus gallinarum]|uniref:hypothetical protein n=1 Tax=Enterococcus gallinarum TaxID=1353 RepID=UPI0016083AFF